MVPKFDRANIQLDVSPAGPAHDEHWPEDGEQLLEAEELVGVRSDQC